MNKLSIEKSALDVNPTAWVVISASIALLTLKCVMNMSS